MVITFTVEFSCELRQELGDPRLAQLLASNDARLRRPLDLPCQDCPANALGHQLGCFGTVALPLAETDERWLLKRLPRDLSTTAGYTLDSAIADFGWDGGYAARLRAIDRERIARGEPPTHFTSPQPARAEGELVIDADQIFDILFGEGHVQAAHPLMLCLFFGLLPHDTPPAELGALHTDPTGLRARHRLPPPSHALARALHALAAAAALKRQFLVQS